MFSTTSFAKEFTEIWECKDQMDRNADFFGVSKVLITAKITSPDSGEIDVAGITHTTRYYVQGFDRRWDFGGEELNKYSFIIQPNGIGGYYKLEGSKSVSASLAVKCTQK